VKTYELRLGQPKGGRGTASRTATTGARLNRVGAGFDVSSQQLCPAPEPGWCPQLRASGMSGGPTPADQVLPDEDSRLKLPTRSLLLAAAIRHGSGRRAAPMVRLPAARRQCDSRECEPDRKLPVGRVCCSLRWASQFTDAPIRVECSPQNRGPKQREGGRSHLRGRDCRGEGTSLDHRQAGGHVSVCARQSLETGATRVGAAESCA